MPKPTQTSFGGQLIQTFADERISPTIKFFGRLSKRNENYEANRLFLRKWFHYWVILEDHYLRFYKDIEENCTPHTHDKTAEIGSIDIANCRVDKKVTGYGNKPHLFRVTTELKTRFLLEAVSDSEAQGWIEEIEAASHVDDEEQNEDGNDGEDSGEENEDDDDDDDDDDNGDEDETEDEEEKADRVPEKAHVAVVTSSPSKTPKPFFRKMSQADTEKSSVRLKRRNIINNDGEEVEIVETFKFESNEMEIARRSSRALELDSSDAPESPKKTHTWDRVISLAEIIPLIHSAALHFNPISGYLLIRGGRFGKSWGRFWCEIKSFEDHEMIIHKQEDLKEKVGKMDISSLTCIEELGTVDSLNAFEITVGAEKYILGTPEERQATAWFEAFSLVQKHIVGGAKKTTPRPTPDKKGWLMKRLGGEDVGSTAIWKSRWCELYEAHLELYDSERKNKLLGKISIDDQSKITALLAGDPAYSEEDVTASKQIKIIAKGKVHTFMASSIEDRDQWMVVLRANSVLIRVGSKSAKVKVRERSGFLKKSDLTATMKKKTRYFKQVGPIVTYYQNEKGAKPLGRFSLKEATVTVSKETDIEVYAGTRCFLLTAENEVERGEWLDSLSEGIDGTLPADAKEEDFFSEEEFVINQGSRRLSVIPDDEKPVTKSYLILKQTGRTRIWKMRFLVLKGSTLFYYKSRTGEDVQSCAFVVVSEKRRLVIGTASVEERNSWISLINAAIKASAYVTNSDQFGDFSEEDDLDVAVTPVDGQPNEKDARDNAGWLEKQGQSKKEWNKRWFVQKGPVLTYYADNKETKPLGRIVLTLDDGIISPRTMKNVGSEPLPFIIETAEGRKISLMAANKDDLVEWVAELKRAVAQSATFVKSPSMEDFSENEDGEVSGVQTKAAMQGWLYRQTGKTWRKRYFVCQKDVLTYFKNSAMSTACGQMVLRYGDQVSLHNDDPEHPHAFSLTAKYPPRRMKLAAQNKEDLERWTKLIMKNVPKSASWEDDCDFQELSEPEDLTKGSEPTGHFSFIATGSTSGWLLKFVEKDRAWKKRYFVQQGPHVAYFKTDREEKPIGRFRLCAGDVFNGNLLMKSQPRVMRLTMESRTITLAALTKADSDEWVKTLYWASTLPKPESELDDEIFSENEDAKTPEKKSKSKEKAKKESKSRESSKTKLRSKESKKSLKEGKEGNEASV